MSKIEFGSSFSDVHLITSLFVSKNSKLNNINTFGANLITMGYVRVDDGCISSLFSLHEKYLRPKKSHKKNLNLPLCSLEYKSSHFPNEIFQIIF